MSGRVGLPEFLQGYKHIKIQDVCRRKPIGPKELAIWVNRTGEWTQLDVQQLWGKKRGTESLCRRLATGLLGLSERQYDSMKDAFENPDGSERIGIYQNEDMKYAIVVRMPLDNKALLGASAAAIGVTGLGVGYLLGGTQNGTKEEPPSAVSDGGQNGGSSDPSSVDWDAAIEEFFKNGYLLFAIGEMKHGIITGLNKIGELNADEYEEERNTLFEFPFTLYYLHRLKFKSQRDGWQPEGLEEFAKYIRVLDAWAKNAKEERLVFEGFSTEEFSQVADRFLENVATLQRHPWLAKFAAESH